ncbi:DUF362 domain-containing protein [Anaerosacchariphilus polymeriproducens]|uniref:DUF362 domain-containing protein n=1 Tax=Anaerosacchariphilus polymeriproducens TaxID=1812858 RepID=A0A371ATB4_9FIRM|nr:DUF362 domain-containing protein [Anaerosacchariphilus polymeriproducens]RDU22803.1 DUF362 domain-containing protein [Anaerosacchariphilus polymeriproducens]
MVNYFMYKQESKYPSDTYYRPDIAYPEYPFKELGISETKNDVYEMIREIFYHIGLDNENFGTENWNPLERYIKPGNTVLIKPNLVNHTNPSEKVYKKGMECLTTHPSIIRTMIDYVYIALKGRGTIIVADAPIQDCDFNFMLEKGGYSNILKFYRQLQDSMLQFGINDLRKVTLVRDKEVLKQRVRKDLKFEEKIINIGRHSKFAHKDYEGKLRIINYDSNDVNRFHHDNVQAYGISDACLQADVIINLPKPKTHRLAGFTGALKNVVGICTRKEFLPHHCKGAQNKGGDEYKNSGILKNLSSNIDDIKNFALKRNMYMVSELLIKSNKELNKLICRKDQKRIKLGGWYGNDTIWRTIEDLNYIVKFCNKSGKLCRTPQRTVIHLGDMIVSGEKEGPLAPSYKKVGGLLFADDPVLFDLCLVRLMGFDYKKIPLLKNITKSNVHWKKDINKLELCSNNPEFCGKINKVQDSFQFVPTSGWIGAMERQGEY